MTLKSLLKKILKLIVFFTIQSLNYLYLKKKKQIVFSQARSRYSGNSRYLFEYLADNGYKVFWLYTDDIQKQKIHNKYSKHLIYRKSLKGLIHTIKSRLFVICHGSNDLGLFWHIAKLNTVLNLWHGICIKNIALVDVKSKDLGNEHITNETSYYSYMTTSSEIDRYVTSASHGVDIRNVLVTGNPRTDHYVRNINVKRNSKSEKNDFSVLYAPTYRDYELEIDLFFPFYDYSSDRLATFFLINSNIKIYLRPHPNDIKSNEQAKRLEAEFPKNIIYYSQQVCDDVDEHMHMFDTIITDYSSIYIEPLLADTPCIFVPFDYELYFKTRGLAYNYDLVTPGPKVEDFTRLLNSLKEASKGAVSWKLQREITRSMFFTHKDDRACERILANLSISDEYKID